jgi:hypothetical protein
MDTGNPKDDKQPDPSQEKPAWERMSREERAAAFEKWAKSHTGGTRLPKEALSRDSIYED